MTSKGSAAKNVSKGIKSNAILGQPNDLLKTVFVINDCCDEWSEEMAIDFKQFVIDKVMELFEDSGEEAIDLCFDVAIDYGLIVPQSDLKSGQIRYVCRDREDLNSIHDWFCFDCDILVDRRSDQFVECNECFRVFHRKCAKDGVPDGHECQYCTRVNQWERDGYIGNQEVDQKKVNLLIDYSLKFIETKMKDIYEKFTLDLDKNKSLIVYKKMDFSIMRQKIINSEYKSVSRFEDDFFVFMHNLTITSIIDDFQQNFVEMRIYLMKELDEMRVCVDCYQRLNDKSLQKSDQWWFCHPCHPPHEVVFVKIKNSFPYPAKVIDRSEDNKTISVRFFDKNHLKMDVKPNNVFDLNDKKIRKSIENNSKLIKPMEMLDKYLKELDEQKNCNELQNTNKVSIDEKVGKPKRGRPKKDKKSSEKMIQNRNNGTKMLVENKETSFESDINESHKIESKELVENPHQSSDTSSQVISHSTSEENIANLAVNASDDSRQLSEVSATDGEKELISITDRLTLNDNKIENETKVDENTENQSLSHNPTVKSCEGMDDIFNKLRAKMDELFPNNESKTTTQTTSQSTEQMKNKNDLNFYINKMQTFVEELKNGNIETNEPKMLSKTTEKSIQSDVNESHKMNVSSESNETLSLIEEMLQMGSNTFSEDILNTSSSTSVGITERTSSASENRPILDLFAPEENYTKIIENIETQSVSQIGTIGSLGNRMDDICRQLKVKMVGLVGDKEREQTNDFLQKSGKGSQNKLKVIHTPFNYCAKHYRPFGQTRQSSRHKTTDNEDDLFLTTNWSEIDGTQYTCTISQWKEEEKRLDILSKVSQMVFTKSVFESDKDVFYCWTAFPGQSNRIDGLKCVMRLDNKGVKHQKFSGFETITLYVLSGEAVITTENCKQQKTIRAAQEVVIPSHTRYAIENRDINSTYFYVVVQRHAFHGSDN